MVFKSEQCSLPEGTISYFVGGEGRDVVYLHPAAGMRFTKPIDHLAGTFRVWAPIVPGFDGTDPIDGIDSIKKVAGILSRFIETVIGGPCDIVGQSLGSWLGAWFAILHPEQVGQIECLTLILHGTKDIRVPQAAVQMLKNRIQRSQLIYVYDAAHGIEVDQPERVGVVIEDFLLRAEAFIVNPGEPAFED